MEEEIAKALNRRAELNPRPVAPNSTSSPVSISPMKLIGWGRRGSVDEGLSSPTSSPTSSAIYSQSPGGSVWTSSSGSPATPSVMMGGGRRDSLKHLWHLQDFGTD